MIPEGGEIDRLGRALTTTSIFGWPARRRALLRLAELSLTPEENDALCRRLSEHVLSKVRIPRLRWMGALVGGTVAIALCAVVIAIAVGVVELMYIIGQLDDENTARPFWHYVRVAFVLAIPVSAIGMFAIHNAATGTCRSAIAALGALGNPRALPAVAAALRHSATMEIAETVLVEIAGSITESHYGVFPPETLDDLCGKLYHADVPTAVAILAILEKIGTGRALPAVEHVAEYGYTDRKRDRARQIMPLLRERADLEKQAAVLLRSAEQSETGLLLVPASIASGSDSSSLVRPAVLGKGNSANLQ